MGDVRADREQTDEVGQTPKPRRVLGPDASNERAVTAQLNLQQERADSSPRVARLRELASLTTAAAVQRKVDNKKEGPQGNVARSKDAHAARNETGMPNGLKAGIEALSGLDMSSVRVHRNSDKPAQLNAHAYAQGANIHLAPRQEHHLPHEAWHVVQQMQGRVHSNFKTEQGIAVNNDARLEQEADTMGNLASSIPNVAVSIKPVPILMGAATQLVRKRPRGGSKQKPETDDKSELVPEPDADMARESESGSEARASSAPERKTKRQKVETDDESESVPDPDADMERESESEARPSSAPARKAKRQKAAVPFGKERSKARSKQKPETDDESEPVPESDADMERESESEARPSSAPALKAKRQKAAAQPGKERSKARSKPKPATDDESEPVPESDADMEREAALASESEARASSAPESKTKRQLRRRQSKSGSKPMSQTDDESDPLPERDADIRRESEPEARAGSSRKSTAKRQNLEKFIVSLDDKTKKKIETRRKEITGTKERKEDSDWVLYHFAEFAKKESDYPKGKRKGKSKIIKFEGEEMHVRMDKLDGGVYPRIGAQDRTTQELADLVQGKNEQELKAFIEGVKGQNSSSSRDAASVMNARVEGREARQVLLHSDTIDHPGASELVKIMLANISDKNSYIQLVTGTRSYQSSYGAVPSQNQNRMIESSSDRLPVYSKMGKLISDGSLTISSAKTNRPTLIKLAEIAAAVPNIISIKNESGEEIDNEEFIKMGGASSLRSRDDVAEKAKSQGLIIMSDGEDNTDDERDRVAVLGRQELKARLYRTNAAIARLQRKARALEKALKPEKQ